ncbi:MAG TPA: zinc-dependent metalloprotease [Candidatus Dormibacteraeota bacterium]|nr:zinc-dependent metalloprotease [Candidatus Dormibacteraeota bacterium]
MTRNASRLGMGIVVGGLLAMGATVAQREILRRAGTRLIDWEAVRSIARRRLGAHDTQLSDGERAAAHEFYREALLRIEPVVAAEIGAELPRAIETPAVIDRREWIDLNLATFEGLFDRVERIMTASVQGADTPGRALARILNRSLGNQQLGFLLAFLARKVLGQYDVSLLAAGPATRGRLHFVEPNITATAAAMRLPLDQFRTFIALHEATHAFEFEAYPWLREHFSGLVAETVEQLAADSGGLGARLRSAMARRGGHWLERMMTPRQLETFQRTQALMSLLEGYSNHVMNAAGARLLPAFGEIHDRFERRNESRGALERAILRITGLDLKIEQYEAGERFVAAVLAQRDRPFLNRVWEAPALLPTLAEIREPARWIMRVQAGATGGHEGAGS